MWNSSDKSDVCWNTPTLGGVSETEHFLFVFYFFVSVGLCVCQKYTLGRSLRSASKHIDSISLVCQFLELIEFGIICIFHSRMEFVYDRSYQIEAIHSGLLGFSNPDTQKPIFQKWNKCIIIKTFIEIFEMRSHHGWTQKWWQNVIINMEWSLDTQWCVHQSETRIIIMWQMIYCHWKVVYFTVDRDGTPYVAHIYFVCERVADNRHVLINRKIRHIEEMLQVRTV